MKKYLYWLFPGIGLILFTVWTVLLLTVDVKNMGGLYNLGLSTLNLDINQVVVEYKSDLIKLLSDILLYISMASVIPFVVIGVVQLIKRKSLKIDLAIYFILIGYVLMAALYLLFNYVVVNYSPSSIAGNLKPSYPSSHVFVFFTLMGIFYLGLNRYTKLNSSIKFLILGIISGAGIMMLVTRLFSGAHYFTDIIGGFLLSIFVIGVVFALFGLGPEKK